MVQLKCDNKIRNKAVEVQGGEVMSGKLYYITDTYGSLYALDDSNKLIVVNREEFATKFTLAKANNIIQKVIKPMQRYQFVLKEATNTAALEEHYMDLGNEAYITTRFDDMDTDWIWEMDNLISFCSQLKQYRVNLNHMLSEVDKEICDIMHYIEFYNLDAAKGYKMYKMLKDCRLRRRKIKDEYEKVGMAITALANEDLIEKMKTALKQMKGLDSRLYTPRILTELFEEAS